MLDTPHKTEMRLARHLPAGLEFRLATVEDVPALVEIGRDFFDISQMEALGAEYSEEGTRAYLTAALDKNFIHFLLATVNEKIVGGISFYYDSAFFKRPMAILIHFYMSPEYRQTRIPRMLLKTACDIAKDEQACTFVVPVNSGSKHIYSLGNLLAKGGFQTTGYIMSRSL